MIAISLAEVAVAIGARARDAVSPWDSISNITQDSIAAVPGSLFVALKGRRVDGHSYLEDAKSRGAIAAVVERYVPVDLPQLLVPSTVLALGDLASLWRGHCNLPVVAVTGSVGKTSTKELTAHVCSNHLRTHKSRKNFNNELGVPNETFRMEREHQVSIMELAMRGPGQIRYLSRMTRPHIGVITNIGISHIEFLGSVESIAGAKAELFLGMDASATTILNRDDAYFEYLRQRSPCEVRSFGESKEADYRISDVQLDARGRPTFRINGVPISMQSCWGKQHAYNAGAAYAVCDCLEILAEDIGERMSSFQTPEGRGAFSAAKCGAIILDSTYNAAPDSIKASLYALEDLKKKGVRTIAVLGEMLELGSHSEEAHTVIGRIVSATSVDVLVTVGEYAEFIGKASNVKADSCTQCNGGR